MHVHCTSLEYLGQFRIKVTGHWVTARSIIKYTHSWVIYLRLKGGLVFDKLLALASHTLKLESPSRCHSLPAGLLAVPVRSLQASRQCVLCRVAAYVGSPYSYAYGSGRASVTIVHALQLQCQAEIALGLSLTTEQAVDRFSLSGYTSLDDGRQASGIRPRSVLMCLGGGVVN